MNDLTILLVVVLIAVLLWRGPTMLPRLGEALGSAVRGMRRTARESLERRDAESTVPDERSGSRR